MNKIYVRSVNLHRYSSQQRHAGDEVVGVADSCASDTTRCEPDYVSNEAIMSGRFEGSFRMEPMKINRFRNNRELSNNLN